MSDCKHATTRAAYYAREAQRFAAEYHATFDRALNADGHIGSVSAMLECLNACAVGAQNLADYWAGDDVPRNIAAPKWMEA